MYCKVSLNLVFSYFKLGCNEICAFLFLRDNSSEIKEKSEDES